jgi:hypothetical protein
MPSRQERDAGSADASTATSTACTCSCALAAATRHAEQAAHAGSPPASRPCALAGAGADIGGRGSTRFTSSRFFGLALTGCLHRVRNGGGSYARLPENAIANYAWHFSAIFSNDAKNLAFHLGLDTYYVSLTSSTSGITSFCVELQTLRSKTTKATCWVALARTCYLTSTSSRSTSERGSPWSRVHRHVPPRRAKGAPEWRRPDGDLAN